MQRPGDGNAPGAVPAAGATAALREGRLGQYLERVETALGRCLSIAGEGATALQEAMRYAVLGGGKRIRPLLVYASGELFGAPPERLDAPACALELIHCYSLVHDDLPSMDDDNLRRGRPTCHRQYGEGMAILVGDALQALAFELLCNDPANRDCALDMALDLALACGPAGMVGGQCLDLAAPGKPADRAQLEHMHRMKTGALIQAAIRIGGRAGGGDAQDLKRLGVFGDFLGLAFQVHDDVLDVVSSTATLGKPQGSDRGNAKPTFPGLLGVAEARRIAHSYRQRALDALAPYGTRAALLRQLADYTVHRDH